MEKAKYGVKSTKRLVHKRGNQEIKVFSVFSIKCTKDSVATRLRYANVNARFIDFLIQSQACKSPPCKRQVLIDGYLSFLDYGSDSILNDSSHPAYQLEDFRWLIEVASVISQKPLQPKSFDNIIPALNHLLSAASAVFTEDLARMAHDPSYQPDTIAVVLAAPADFLPRHFRDREFYVNAHSAIADSIRPGGERVQRPRRLGQRNRKQQQDRYGVPLTLDEVKQVIEHAANSRDASFWSLMAAAGLRPHEVLNTQWEDFDLETGKPFVLDPAGRRLGRNITEEELIKFKGRVMSETHLIGPLRGLLYESLAAYYKDWFIPYPPGSPSNHIFQYVEPARRGEPYFTVTNEALNDAFKAACERAQIRPPMNNPEHEWTLYSLRHFYGDYLTNEMGLPLSDTQTCMGHASASSTRGYARTSRKKTEAAFEADDKHRMSNFAPSRKGDNK
ncbi:tyrosine-type recombinase/integrase [Paraburkholderia sp. RAU6.4a]|uniref:tyrosine-type recombinase/integrase n=1 Tax=Paraburkholderia sp. RAU6.4a TaxID=2991067 RepID=UPI003D19C47E